VKYGYLLSNAGTGFSLLNLYSNAALDFENKNTCLCFDNNAKIFYTAKKGLLKQLKRTKRGLKKKAGTG